MSNSGSNPSQQVTDAQLKGFQTSIRSFLADVSFGVGRIWRANPLGGNSNQAEQVPFQVFIYEFSGSLLTGILVSIGAPYWHDILQALSALRPDKAKT
jgi:hypothetical protein